MLILDKFFLKYERWEGGAEGWDKIEPARKNYPQKTQPY